MDNMSAVSQQIQAAFTNLAATEPPDVQFAQADLYDPTKSDHNKETSLRMHLGIQTTPVFIVMCNSIIISKITRQYQPLTFWERVPNVFSKTIKNIYDTLSSIMIDDAANLTCTVR
jgi:hypothetical protein